MSATAAAAAGAAGTGMGMTSSFMTGMGQGIGGAAGAIGGSEIGYWLGEATGSNKRRMKQQLKQQDKLNENAYKYNAMMAQLGFDLEKAMYDHTFAKNLPTEQVKHLKAAGLNPALLYGGGAGAGMGGTTGSQGGAGVSGGQAANSAQQQQAQAAQMNMGMNLMSLQADIRLKNSEAKLNEARALREGETLPAVDKVNAALTGEKIKTEEAIRAGINLDNEIKEFDALVSKKMKEHGYQSEAAIAKFGNIIAQADILYGEAKSARARGEVDEATVETTIQTIVAGLQNTISSTIRNLAGAKLDNTKADAVATELLQGWADLAIEMRGQNVSVKNTETMASRILWAAGIQAAGGAISDVVGMLTKLKMLKMPQETFKHVSRAPRKGGGYNQTETTRRLMGGFQD